MLRFLCMQVMLPLGAPSITVMCEIQYIEPRHGLRATRKVCLWAQKQMGPSGMDTAAPVSYPPLGCSLLDLQSPHLYRMDVLQSHSEQVYSSASRQGKRSC